jgi:hypothetical protein
MISPVSSWGGVLKDTEKVLFLSSFSKKTSPAFVLS